LVKLLEPLRINGMTIPNRVIVPAMVTRLSGEDGYVNDAVIDRYVRYAEGHVGLIVVEATAIHGNKSGPLLRLSDDSFIPGHRDLVSRVHAARIRRSSRRSSISSRSRARAGGRRSTA
jgi:2,4-dienoyl-CoA reductase-like NADH-dependent reductase (Old Yellow Enzyme family)